MGETVREGLPATIAILPEKDERESCSCYHHNSLLPSLLFQKFDKERGREGKREVENVLESVTESFPHSFDSQKSINSARSTVLSGQN